MSAHPFLTFIFSIATFWLYASSSLAFQEVNGELNSPVLSYSSHIVDDDMNGASEGDGDGLIEAGESIEIPISIYNAGDQIAHNVVAILSCTDPNITILDDQESFGAIAIGQTDWCNNDFDFAVSPDSPEKDVEFILSIYADEGEWTSTFTIHISVAGLPILTYMNHQLDDDDNNSSCGDGDGIAESGESIELALSLFNSGEAIANNTSAVLSCSDPHIEITDHIESFGDILVNEEAWSNYNYNFDIAPNCPDKDVEFILDITSEEGSWTNSFTISILHPGSPNLKYANHIIDDDSEGSSDGDGDGIAEAGETIEIPIQITNTGIITASDIFVTISTNDEDIIILDSTENYPDICSGDIAWSNNDFDIAVSETCIEKNITFYIEMESEQGTWNDSFIIHISEQGMPQLAFEEFIIDDDNIDNSHGNSNGIVEAGEQIELPILLVNIGEGNAHHVSAILSTEDPFIDIIDANENYGTINAGTSDWSNNEFDFYVLPSCPEKEVVFTLSIISDEGSYSSNFTIHIMINGSPNLSFSSLIIDDDNEGSSLGDGDNKPEPGENIEMPISLINTGSSIAHNVMATISCNDTDIFISDSIEYFGTIMINEEVWSALDFDFDIAYGTPEKMVKFDLFIQSDEGSWSDSLIIPIFTSEGIPLLAYSDHMIDDDDDGSSNGNADGLPSAGETIQMPIKIENMGDAAAHNISAVLSSTNTCIIITDSTESFQDLNVGENSWTNYAFDYEISATCPDTVIMFTLLTTADEGTWTSTFFLPIIGLGSPHLVFESLIINDDNIGQSAGDNDGIAEPNENIELQIQISNVGGGPVNSVVGHLTTNDPHVDITDNHEQFGDISSGSQVWNSNDFNFQIAENCPEKDIIFYLELAGEEGIWNISFLVHVCTHSYFMVQASIQPNNGGSVQGGGEYPSGETCSLIAQANAGYEFDHWKLDGEIVSSSETYNFTVLENIELVAIFKIKSYHIAINTNLPEGGFVEGCGSYQYGETVTLTATANENYRFSAWKESGVIISENQNYSFTVIKDRELEAVFKLANAIEELDHQVVLVTPNPSSGIFHLDVNGTMLIEVTDSRGKLVLSQLLENGHSEIDLEPFANGLYFLKSYINSEIQIIKLVKR